MEQQSEVPLLKRPGNGDHIANNANTNTTNNDNDIADTVGDQAEQDAAQDTSVSIENKQTRKLFYRISESPPLHLISIFALQQCLMSIAGSLSTSLLVSELVCAKDVELIKSQVLSSTMFMSGVTTFLMVTIGVRLPVFQGPTNIYIIPLLALSEMQEWKCPTQEQLAEYYGNSTQNVTVDTRGQYPVPLEIIHGKLGTLMGSLMVVGFIHFLIGATGLVGVLLRFIGPVTIVPAITLIGLYIYKTVVRFSETQWGVSLFTAVVALILSLYLRGVRTPLIAWGRKRGFYIKWFPLHQVFAILFAILLGWCLSAILTVSGSLSDDPLSTDYYARTDSRNYVIRQSPWFFFPYPGQFGMPSFSASASITFLLATGFSVLDSIGDYSACARMCFVPPPPTHAVNRGIAIEGAMSFVAGAVGIGHATASYGNNIGAIGITRVASRRVFQATGVLYILMGVVGKIGSFFITIPYCVIGGGMIIGVGIFVGIVLSNLQYVDLNSSRNLAIIGVSLLLGLMLPHWVEKTPDGIQTGNEDADRIIEVLLSNPCFVGGVIACFLDNTVPGTTEERGLNIWQQEYAEGDTTTSGTWEEGPEVYQPPFVPECLKRSMISKYIPIIPSYYKDPSHTK
ncbi:solute carrier family 23 member 1-like [Haliotis asinina]|uniref:solute carrier family 23 member 1-like n=1 Tax=Haliotis asinina TaxID=109174 RepID=UPI003531DE02